MPVLGQNPSITITHSDFRNVSEASGTTACEQATSLEKMVPYDLPPESEMAPTRVSYLGNPSEILSMM